jgi:Tfp pilus assembly protein FimT
MAYQLLTINNTKTLRGQTSGWLTALLHLTPADLSGVNVCAASSAGCRAACLNTAGHGGMIQGDDFWGNRVQAARLRRTQWWLTDADSFLLSLASDIDQARAQAQRLGLRLCVRLNGTSDIRWERYPVASVDNIMALFPDVQFYDYTKIANRQVTGIQNYHLTFSRTEHHTDADLQAAWSRGQNVAVVMQTPWPTHYLGRPVIDGGTHDLRHQDPAGVCVALPPLGRARADQTGFVMRVHAA